LASGSDLFLGRHIEGAERGPDGVQLGLLVAEVGVVGVGVNDEKAHAAPPMDCGDRVSVRRRSRMTNDG
jgi:hypothetical protein